VADRFVLDTSALLTLRSDEPGAGRVAAILQSGRTGRASMLLSFMTRMEMLYRIGASDGDEAARRAVMLVEAAGIEWVSCEAEILAEAARLKSAGGLLRRRRVDRCDRVAQGCGSRPQGCGVRAMP
jgi:uncharacterized protein with PIN domain